MLAERVEKLQAWAAANLPYRWRVVVADNASTDGTLDVARKLAGEHPDDVVYLHLDREGRERALRQGWLGSAADAMCCMDVDLSTDLERFCRLRVTAAP